MNKLFNSFRTYLYTRIYLTMYWKLNSDIGKKRDQVSLKLFFKFFPTPKKHFQKMNVLRKYGENQIWIESGTYMGEGASHLSEFAMHIHTIEPSLKFFELAKIELCKKKNITQHFGNSENLLNSIIIFEINKGTNKISFWLDGHYSGGDTYLGNFDTPILSELTIIKNFLTKLDVVKIFIDDIRCFNPTLQQYKDYPKLDYLIQFAKENGLEYFIRSDIFVMQKLN